MRKQAAIDAMERGRDDGFRSGWSDGWRVGASKGIEAALQPPSPTRRPARVLYVPQGFEAIDQGVIAALRNVAAEVHVSPAAEMVSQAERLRPDLVLVMNGLHVFPADHLEQIDGIRRLAIRTAIWFVDDPYVTDHTVRIAPRYDYVFTHERSCVQLYRSSGCSQVHHLPLAAHTETFMPMYVPQQYRNDICFIGMAFWNRVALFDEIAPYLQDKKVMIGGKLWERMDNYASIKRFVHDGWIEVPETVKYYNGAKIVINIHRTPEAGKDNLNSMNWHAESINPRTFEMASCGTLQLTDMRNELPEYYKVGSEIAVFHNAQSLIEQLDYYLTNEEERLRMAMRGFKRTKKDHTFEERLGRLFATVGL
ncbi:CgeB family protein [Cohnella soli]|uniref:DUF3880 domain-containing protein n=1 Tax=Cohnella soli TaxID=425005 RepID=A0ABW0HWT7_9BACL